MPENFNDPESVELRITHFDAQCATPTVGLTGRCVKGSGRVGFGEFAGR